MQVSSDLFYPHAPAIERSQSDRTSNVFVCLPCFALLSMYTGIPGPSVDRFKPKTALCGKAKGSMPRGPFSEKLSEVGYLNRT